MKLSLVILSLLISSTAFSQTDPQKCFSITNNIDRKYCIDKYLESLKDKLSAEKKSWNGQLAPAAKAARIAELEVAVQSKKDQMALITSEIALYESQTKEVAALTDAVAAAPKQEKKKEKKKIKLPFGIKL